MPKTKDLEKMLGEPRAAIRSTIVPFLVSILTIQINVFVDTYWVSGLGINAVSGMTSAVPLYTIFGNIAVGLSVGVTATIAFRLGQGNPSAASRLAGNAVVYGLALSLLCSFIIFVMIDPVVDLMGAGDVRAEVRDYILPYVLLSPLTVLNTIFGGLLRAEGSAKRSTTVQMSAALFNMVLDPILIFGLGLGLMGAGFATVLSAGMGLAIGAHWFLGKKTSIEIGRNDLKPSLEVGKELMTVAGPRTVEGITMSLVVLFQRVFIIMASGTPGVSLFNVPFRYVNLSQCPSEATGMAMVPVAAAAYGQKNLPKMRSAMSYALKLAMCFSLIMTVVLFLFSDLLISFFTSEPSMAEWKDAFLWNMRMYCLILPFFTVQTIGSSMLQSMKKSKRPMEVTMILGVVRMVLFWIASSHGYQAITYALILSYVISAALMMGMARMEFRRLESAAAPTS